VTPEDKIKKNQKRIFNDYDIVLSLKSYITLKLAINQPEPVEVVPTEEPELEPQTKKNAKGKKK
jgi:hypothetical protein